MNTKRLLVWLGILIFITVGILIFGRVSYTRNLDKGIEAALAQNITQAEQYFSRSVFWGPRSSLAHAWLGVSLERQEKDTAALRELNKALEMGHTGFRAYFSLGNIYFRQGEWAKAEENYRKSVALDVINEENKSEPLRKLGLSIARQKDDRLGEAVRYAFDATVANPENARAWSSLATIQSDMKNYESALRSVNVALNVDANYCFASATKTSILTDMKRYNEALQASDRGVELGQKDSPSCLIATYVVRGELYEAQGNTTAALAEYEKALGVQGKNGTDQTNLQEAQERINELRR